MGIYDLIIIGGGPAGLTAGLYAARARLKCLLLERMVPGGQILTTDWVENYPGFPDGISGFELVDRMKNQAERFGLEIQTREVKELEPLGSKKLIRTDQGDLETQALILATGAVPRKLEIEGEGLLTGKGVSYCATCDGPFYRDREVAVVGGGDTAVEEALFLTRFATRVHLVHRRDRLRAVQLLQDRALASDKINMILDTIVTRITGDNGVEGVELKNVKTGAASSLAVHGVFIFVGYDPNNELVLGKVATDPNGFVTTNENMETSLAGVFAAGDIRSKQLRQVATAVGEGAAATFAAERYLEELKN